MDEERARKLLEAAQNNNDFAREQLIVAYRDTVAAIAARICRRTLGENDDELSIALIALNEAINTYDPLKGTRFLSYARTVIHRRLVDYFRREARFRHQSLDAAAEDGRTGPEEARLAREKFAEQEEAMERAEMVGSYLQALAAFNITLNDLVQSSPKHNDTRITLNRVARVLSGNPPLLAHFNHTGQLPVKELMPLTGCSRKVLEKGRRYVIAQVLILTRAEFAPMRSFLQLAGEEGDPNE